MPYQPYDQEKGTLTRGRLDHIEREVGRLTEGGVEAPSWGEVQDKPEEFPPEGHEHTITQVTGLQDALESKADASDIPPVPDVSGFVTEAQVRSIVQEMLDAASGDD